MIFRRAVRRLTVAYTAVQLVVYGLVALGVYLFVTATFDFDPEGGGISAEQGFALLGGALLAGGAALLVVAPLAGWLMARAALRPIRASYERQQRFVDGASHELRTPLTLVQGELELALSRSRTPAQYRAAIELARAATDAVVRLSDDLLILARGDDDDLDATFTAFDLAESARSAVEAVGRDDDRVVVAPSADTVILGNADLVCRAIANLVSNAMKFTGPQGRVRVATARTRTHSTVTVRDTGTGMTPDELRHAADRFWRADSARTTEGTGLGLALVDAIAQAHGGTLTLEATVGVGTTATLTFPSAPTPRA